MKLSENFQPLSTATDDTHDRTKGSVLRGTLANTPKHEKQKHTQSVNDECAYRFKQLYQIGIQSLNSSLKKPLVLLTALPEHIICCLPSGTPS